MTSLARIVFMGSPDFAVPILEALSKHCSILGVVTQPDRPAGRGGTLKPPAVKEAALRLGLPVIQPERLRQPETMDQLRAWAPDVIVVAAFGQILRQDVLDLPPFGCVNVHASLLPRGRGAAPIQAAILAGDAETGVTIMKMDSGIDTGPIISQRSIPIAEDETGGSLFEKLSALGADLLLEILPRYLSGEIIPQPQPEEGATYAPMLKKEDGLLDFTLFADELERRVRAMHPWPGAYFEWQGQPLKVHKAHADAILTYVLQPSGTHWVQNDWPAVVAKGNSILVLDEVQPAGKKPMPGKAFLAGARDW
jgi:methionyl-tRNA formyltransferase